MAEFTMTIIGSGSALPMHGRHPSAQVIRYDDLCCLIDCGEGTQERLKDAGIRLFRINLILISHLHGDHVFGLPGLLSSFTHLKRTEKLTIYGPVGIKGLLGEIIKYTELKISYPLEIIEKEPRGLTRIMLHNNLEIMTFPLNHRIPCNGYLLKEVRAQLSLRKELVQELHLSVEQMLSLKRGENIEHGGRKIANAELTLGSGPAVSYAYCSDTRYDQRLLSWIKDVSVLYYETTFMNEMAGMAEQTGHSTSGEAGRMAAAAGVSCLITGHYSSRYTEIDRLVEEARVHFGHVLAAEEGKKYNIRNLARGIIPSSGME